MMWTRFVTQSKNDYLFSVDAQWNTWGSFGACSLTCGPGTGTETRTRSCTPAQGAGTPCNNLPIGATEQSSCTADVADCPGGYKNHLVI